jgi:selenocysteine lyase/cysteine desulfurase
VQKLDVDFYVTGALKYLLCPSGIAFLYVRPELIRSLTPTITGWFAQQNPFAFNFSALPCLRHDLHFIPQTLLIDLGT